MRSSRGPPVTGTVVGGTLVGGTVDVVAGWVEIDVEGSGIEVVASGVDVSATCASFGGFPFEKPDTQAVTVRLSAPPPAARSALLYPLVNV